MLSKLSSLVTAITNYMYPVTCPIAETRNTSIRVRKLTPIDFNRINQIKRLKNNSVYTIEIPRNYLSNRHLTNLQSLYLANNKITVIPIELGTLTQLQTIDFTNNAITVIPDELDNLVNLQIFYI